MTAQEQWRTLYNVQYPQSPVSDSALGGSPELNIVIEPNNLDLTMGQVDNVDAMLEDLFPSFGDGWRSNDTSSNGAPYSDFNPSPFTTRASVEQPDSSLQAAPTVPTESFGPAWQASGVRVEASNAVPSNAEVQRLMNQFQVVSQQLAYVQQQVSQQQTSQAQEPVFAIVWQAFQATGSPLAQPNGALWNMVRAVAPGVLGLPQEAQPANQVTPSASLDLALVPSFPRNADRGPFAITSTCNGKGKQPIRTMRTDSMQPRQPL